MVVSSRTKELRIIGEVRPLLSQLEAVESLAAKYRRKEKKDDEPSTSSLPSANIDDVIESIRVEIHSITDIFRMLEIWEREMKGKIEDIAKVIDEALEVSNSENQLHSKLLTVKENASGFKGSLITTTDSPLRLERLEEFVNSVSHGTEPLPYYRSPPSASTDHVDHQYEQYEEERRQRPTHYLEYARSWRTCVNVNHRYLKFSRNKFEEMKHRCVALMLGRWHNSAKHHHIEIENMEFINWLASFECLQRLSLRGISRITELPSSIGNIPHLRFLDLRACYDLQRLPVELTWLKSLEHLDVSECYFLTHMPKGMESLTNLCVLKGFKVGSPQRLDSCQLGELSKLRKLKKLSISVARDSMLDEAQFDKLSCLTSLISLTIIWSISASASRNVADSTTLSSSSMVLTVYEMDISPPPNLEKLDIRCIPQSTKPQWLDASKLSKLKRLYIRGGNMNLQSICASGLTWTSVQVIRLRFLQGVNLEEAELHNAFPDLDYLEIHKCNDSKFDYRWQSPRHEEEAKRRRM